MTQSYAGRHPHDYQAPTQADVAAITAVRAQVKKLYDTIVESTPIGHYRDAALLQLDIVSALANKAIVMGPEFVENFIEFSASEVKA